MDENALRPAALRGESTAGSASAVEGKVRSQLRRRALLLLKLSVTIGLSLWIVSLVDWSQFWSILIASKLSVIGLVVLMRFFGLTISSFKWQQLLAIHGLRYRLSQLVRWYLVATFLNHFLPTSIGGDGYRIYKTWHNGRGKACAVVAILVERATGLAALALLGYAAAIATYLSRGDPVAGTIAVGGTIGLPLAAGAVWLSIRLRLLGVLTRSRFWPAKLTELSALAGDFRDHPQKSALVGVISFVFHVNKILVVWLLLYALGARANLLELTVAILAVEVIGLLPISLGGLGVVEGSFIYVMGHYGVSQEIGLATILLMRVLMVPYSLIGAGLYFMGDRDVRDLNSGESGRSRARLDTAHAS